MLLLGSFTLARFTEKTGGPGTVYRFRSVHTGSGNGKQGTGNRKTFPENALICREGFRRPEKARFSGGRPESQK